VGVLIHGKVSYLGLNVLNRGIFRELVMELRLIFGKTTGFLEVIT